METSLENLYVYQRIVPTWDVVACLGGAERGRGGGGRREGGEGREDLLFPLRFSIPLPFSFSAPAAQTRVVGVHRSPGAHNPDCATSACAHVTAFLRTSLLLERFWRRFWISLYSTNQSAKPTDLKMIFFCLLIKFSFPFWYLILRMRS